MPIGLCESDRTAIAPRLAVAGAALLYVALSLIGITWGLPSRDIDRFLFPGEEPWSGQRILELARVEGKFNPMLGADVDPDAIRKTAPAPRLNGDEAAVAQILIRYRLFTYQPDEMITMMALAGMRPRELTFDPRLYQYGGLFIYPVGALIGACDVLGLIDVRADVGYYLDHPDEFGKFYLVSRAYSAFGGLIGLLLVASIARRLAGRTAGWLAATFFAVLPVVTCMSHEGKPHLPGATLMLLAIWFAVRHFDAVHGRGSALEFGNTGGRSDTRQTLQRWRYWWLACATCGAAVGMVLSSWPVALLIPLVAALARSDLSAGASAELAPTRGVAWFGWLRDALLGSLLSVAVYLATNPYVVINAVTNRAVLQSNFGNSLQMYRVDRLAGGLRRVVELTLEGATAPIAIVGLVGICACLRRTRREAWPLIAVAFVFFAQFVCIGAGKPAEYGRFGVFTNSVLAIMAACALARLPSRFDLHRWCAAAAMFAWLSLVSAAYVIAYRADALGEGSRHQSACEVADWLNDLDRLSVPVIAVQAEPAPYSCPPIPFHRLDLRLWSTGVTDTDFAASGAAPEIVLATADDPAAPNLHLGEPDPGLWDVAVFHASPRLTPISWADKPFIVLRRLPLDTAAPATDGPVRGTGE